MTTTKSSEKKSSIADLVGSPPAGKAETSSAATAKSSKVSSTKTAKSAATPTTTATSAAKSSAAKTTSRKPNNDGADIPVQPVRPRNNGSSNDESSRPASQGSGRRYDRSNGRGNNFRNNGRDNGRDNGRSNNDQPTETVTGTLDSSRDGHGILRVHYSPDEGDAYISASQIRRFRLRPGDVISGPARKPKDNERYWGLLQVETINGEPAEKVANSDRVKFHSLTPVYPDSQIKLETGEEPLATRMVDLIAPIGKGQRSLVVSPPKAGKTTLLKEIATGIAINHPEIHLMAVLVGERPEEVTDIRRHIEEITKGKGEAAASNFDEAAQEQCRVAELALERAKRLVEKGKDVVILLDSITRLARAYNLAMPTSGRTLSGGFDPAALFPPKRFFGAARNFEVQGSLTIIGTALVDTGSRMDDLIYEEFKGTGNQEILLVRRLAERRVHPAIDVQRSGTRRDDLLSDPVTYQSIITLHRMLDMIDKDKRTETLIERLKRSKSNKEFLASLKEG